MLSSANERMYCYLDGTPQWSGKDGDDVEDDDDGDDANDDEYIHVDADGDDCGVNIHYANDKSFF